MPRKSQKKSTTDEPFIEEPIPVSSHYVDNKKFLQALIEYRTKVLDARSEGKEQPQVPNYIGDCFIKIATHLSYKSNFINYPFKDDMISDGIENCLTAVAKFDPDKSSNPFAYYTQIIYFAFLRRIQKEKKLLATKYKMIENIDIDTIITQEHDAGEFSNQFLDYLKRQMDQVDIDKRIISIPKKNTSDETKTFIDLDE